jgi:two-component system phosphate regulon sensor histidine kinase PhoR
MIPKRLLGQLLAAYVALTVVMMLIAGLYAAHIGRALYLERISAELEGAARLAASRIARAQADRVPGESQTVCQDLAAAYGVRATVILPTGKVLADSHEDPRMMDNHGDRPEIAAAVAGEIGRSTRWSNTLHADLRYVALPATRQEKIVAVVRAALPLATLARTLNPVYARLAAFAAIMTLVLALVSLWVARRILRPLERLRAGADRFARGELGHRLAVGGPLEMSELAESLNRMAAELDQRIRTILYQQDERQAMLASMEEGVLAVDNSGRIVSLNDACARLLDGSVETLCGRLLHSAVRKPDLLRFVDAGLVSEAAIEAELQVLGAPDRRLHAHGTALHDHEARRTGVLVVLHDVTRLRQLETVRRDFVANVSHELKTPITSIKGFVETLIDEGLADKANDLHFLEIVLRQVNRMDAIIADLLALARIERGAEDQSIPLEPGEVRGVLLAAREMCEKKAADKRITIDVQCPEDLRAQLNAPLLEQAVVNLIDNAVKYSEPEAIVHVAAAREGDGVSIAVRDSGCGIAAQHLGRLFERFYRVDKARSREMGGTGLGLSIVKHIMAAHRGTVTVESAVGKGSTFVLHLPSLPAAGAEAATPVVRSTDG